MLKANIDDYLVKYDCPISYFGYRALREVLWVACHNYGEIKTNLKSIYLDASKKLQMTRLAIERNLHTLLDIWKDSPRFKELFPTIPTNGNLVITLAFKIFHTFHSVFDTLILD